MKYSYSYLVNLYKDRRFFTITDSAFPNYIMLKHKADKPVSTIVYFMRNTHFDNKTLLAFMNDETTKKVCSKYNCRILRVVLPYPVAYGTNTRESAYGGIWAYGPEHFAELESRNYFDLYPHNEAVFNKIDLFINAVEADFTLKRKAGVILPTGWGKSFLMGKICSVHKDRKIVIVAPTNLIKRSLQKLIVKNEDMKNTVVVSYQKLYRDFKGNEHGLEKDFSDVDIMLFDEIHHGIAQNYYLAVEKLLEQNRRSVAIGFTATPLGGGRDKINFISHFDTNPIVRVFAQDAWIHKTICPVEFIQSINIKVGDETFNPINEDKDTSLKKLDLSPNDCAIEHLRDYFKSRPLTKVIIFIRTWDEEEKARQQFARLYKKIGSPLKPIVPLRIGCINKGKKEDERVQKQFNETNDDVCMVLVGSNSITEGYHPPRVDLTWLTYKTESQNVAWQQIGRCMHFSTLYNDEHIPIVIDPYVNIKRDKTVEEYAEITKTDKLHSPSTGLGNMHAYKKKGSVTAFEKVSSSNINGMPEVNISIPDFLCHLELFISKFKKTPDRVYDLNTRYSIMANRFADILINSPEKSAVLEAVRKILVRYHLEGILQWRNYAAFPYDWNTALQEISEKKTDTLSSYEKFNEYCELYANESASFMFDSLEFYNSLGTVFKDVLRHYFRNFLHFLLDGKEAFFQQYHSYPTKDLLSNTSHREKDYLLSRMRECREHMVFQTLSISPMSLYANGEDAMGTVFYLMTKNKYQSAASFIRNLKNAVQKDMSVQKDTKNKRGVNRETALWLDKCGRIDFRHITSIDTAADFYELFFRNNKPQEEYKTEICSLILEHFTGEWLPLYATAAAYIKDGFSAGDIIHSDIPAVRKSFSDIAGFTSVHLNTVQWDNMMDTLCLKMSNLKWKTNEIKEFRNFINDMQSWKK